MCASLSPLDDTISRLSTENPLCYCFGAQAAHACCAQFRHTHIHTWHATLCTVACCLRPMFLQPPSHHHMYVPQAAACGVMYPHTKNTGVPACLESPSPPLYCRPCCFSQGPTSSGKTSLVGYLAAQTGHKFVRINNHQHTDLQEYLGSWVPDEQGEPQPEGGGVSRRCMGNRLIAMLTTSMQGLHGNADGRWSVPGGQTLFDMGRWRHRLLLLMLVTWS
jgi:hypothetical protein